MFCRVFTHVSIGTKSIKILQETRKLQSKIKRHVFVDHGIQTYTDRSSQQHAGDQIHQPIRIDCRRQGAVTLVFLLWLPNTTINLTLFVLVLHVLRTVFGFIFLSQFNLCYSYFCIFLQCCVCFVMYFIVHAAFVCIKPTVITEFTCKSHN